MLESTADYFRALQREDYLLFLTWTDFVIKKHHAEEEGGETINDLLLLEWLNMGFTIADAKNVAILYTLLSCADDTWASSKLAFLALSIIGVTYQCMAYSALNLPTPTNLSQLGQYRSEAKAFKEQVAEAEGVLRGWPKDNKKIQLAFQQLNPVIQVMRIIGQYLNFLRNNELPNDLLKDSRIGLLCTFEERLRTGTVNTIDIPTVNSEYAIQFRKMHSHPAELEFIDQLSPLGIFERSLQAVAVAAKGFFGYLQPSVRPQKEATGVLEERYCEGRSDEATQRPLGYPKMSQTQSD